MLTRWLLACAMGAVMVVANNEPTGAQVRSLDEVKQEVLRRAGKINPFNHIRPDDAQRIVASLTSLDRDHWAETWCKVGLDYEAQGDARAKAGASGKELADIYFLASDYCRIGRYPVANTPGKKAAYQHSVPHVPQGGAAFREPAADRRDSVPGNEAHRLSHDPEGRNAPAGRDALGRCRRLEGRP